MQRHRNIRLRKSREQAILQHFLRAADRLFRRLADQDQSSVPGILGPRHDFSGAQQRRHVDIVPAGVHHRNVLSGIVFRMNFARVRQARFLFNRQCIEFCPQQDRWPRAILQHGNDPRATDVLGHFVSRGAQAGSQFGRSLHFVSGEFGMLDANPGKEHAHPDKRSRFPWKVNLRQGSNRTGDD